MIKKNKILTLLIVALLGMSVGVAPAHSAPPPKGYKTDKVLTTFKNPNFKQSLPVRQGFWDHLKPGRGFGYDKVRNKHGISDYTVIRRVASSPRGVWQGTDRTASAWAGHYKCVGSKCTLQEQREVRAIITAASVNDIDGWPVKGSIGLKTLYCVNPNNAFKCPSWVTPAILRPGTPVNACKAASNEAESTEASGFAYAPLPEKANIDAIPNAVP